MTARTDPTAVAISQLLPRPTPGHRAHDNDAAAPNSLLWPKTTVRCSPPPALRRRRKFETAEHARWRNRRERRRAVAVVPTSAATIARGRLPMPPPPCLLFSRRCPNVSSSGGAHDARKSGPMRFPDVSSSCSRRRPPRTFRRNRIHGRRRSRIDRRGDLVASAPSAPCEHR